MTECKHKILVNKAKCNKCGDIIESMYRTHYVTCSCGNLSVDGGKDYIRRGFMNETDYIEMSEMDDCLEGE